MIPVMYDLDVVNISNGDGSKGEHSSGCLNARKAETNGNGCMNF
jgi:hypothetical protein